MGLQPDEDKIRRMTSQLSEETLWELSSASRELVYRPVLSRDGNGRTGPAWRVRFEPTFDPTRRFGLEINGEVVLGRGDDSQGFVSLNDYGADELGVSRQHAMLRPTISNLYILDLGSTNGTRRNGHLIGVNTPYQLSNGDLLSLGKLEFVIHIIARPTGYTAMLSEKIELADAVLPIARAITSQLRVDEVLKQALEYACSIASVNEASIWLVDEQTGELFLEAERGIEDEQIRCMRLPVADTLAGRVVETGRPLRANREHGGEQIKVKTGYLVEAVIYVPLKLGGVTFGVLSAAHREKGKMFSQRDEQFMEAIADFTAIAVQNARLYQAMEQALTRRSKTVMALNYALSHDLKRMLSTTLGYTGLLETYADAAGEDVLDMARQIMASTSEAAQLIERLGEATAICEGLQLHHTPCDMVEVVTRAVADSEEVAAVASVRLDFHLMGEPYTIQGDGMYLYRSALNLIDNAIKYSPVGAAVQITLTFGRRDIVLRVMDDGSGIPEDDLPSIFDKYFRGRPSADGRHGLGLGLELARTIVEAHKGTVTARNIGGHGAEFAITLPSTLHLA